MAAMLRRYATLLVLLSCSLLLVLGGCEKSGAGTASPGEDDTDGLTRSLLEALRANDPEAVSALATDTLKADLGSRDLAVIARTLAWLGGVASLGRGAEEPVTGGVRRSYALEFDGGSVDMRITVVGAKVEGFEFDEQRWAALVERAADASAGELRVASFDFVDAEGQPLAGALDPAAIRYALALEGLDAQLREHHVTVSKAVFDTEGNQVYRQDQNDDIRFPQAETGSSGGRITGMVAVPGPGHYELELKINDLVGAQSMTHRAAFAIEAQPGPGPG